MNEHDFNGDRPRQLLVCALGADCASKFNKRDGNALAFYDAVKTARNQAGANRELYVVRTSCQGWCEEAPVCQLLPEGRVYKDLKVGDAAAIVQACLQGGEGLEKNLVWDYSQPRAANEKRRRA
jgi:(2Fe-2S) ferredoxin